MTAFSNHETGPTWRTQLPEAPVRLYLSGASGDAGELAGVRVAGLPLELNIVPVTDWIDPEELNSATAAIIQFDPETPASIKRFQKLAASTETPLIAAAYEPPLPLVRMLLKTGAADVLALPLDPEELETSLQQVQQDRAPAATNAPGTAVAKGKLVSVLKASGGVGATSLISQVAAKHAAREAQHGRETCLLDLDVQFGDAAFQLGLQSSLSVADLLAAGSRIDGSLIRATGTRHESGLTVIGAPRELLPIEGHSPDEFIQIADCAAREFSTTFLELPTNWTNWSLSLLARSNLVLVVLEMTIPSINRARRQLDLLRSEGLGDLNYMVVINRFDKSQLRTVRASDVEGALGLPITQTIADDPQIMRAASDRGVTIDQVKRKSAVGKDIERLDQAVAETLGLER